MEIMLGLISTINIFIVIISIFCLFFEKWRKTAKKSIMLASVFLLFVGYVASKINEQKAIELGFKSYEDLTEAKNLNISDPQVWEIRKKEINEEKIRVQKEKAEKIEAIKQEEEKRCREDITCIAEKNFIRASAICSNIIERLAKNDFLWIDKLTEQKFSDYRWKDKKKGTITYSGDRIKFQNGFGAWIIHSYECDWDTQNNIAINARAKPGRI